MGTSIINLVEYSAPEIMAKHSPHRFGEDEPVLWTDTTRRGRIAGEA